MKLSTKVRYGMRAMVEIAMADRDRPLNISQIAELQGISQKYLESLLVKLKKQEILKSIRGQKGGYMLNKDPEEIRIYDISLALEGNLSLVDCKVDGISCDKEKNCTTTGLWRHLTEKLTEEMRNITLSDLIEKNY